jgi:hypothetical protein
LIKFLPFNKTFSTFWLNNHLFGFAHTQENLKVLWKVIIIVNEDITKINAFKAKYNFNTLLKQFCNTLSKWINLIYPLEITMQYFHYTKT